MEPTDPRLAALYDSDNPDGPDHDYFRTLADRSNPDVIVDLGCGTGILTVTLVSGDRSVVGVDPDLSMLAIARSRPGSEQVRWVLGDSRQIEPGVDLVLMTGNVVQHIGPDEWDRTLADVSSALRSGGRVAFESRNPAAQAWKSWTRELTIGTRSTADGPLTEWIEASTPDEHGTIELTASNRWDDTGEELVVTQSLTFRSLETIRRELASAGLVVTEVWGGWHGEQFGRASNLMVVEAQRS